MTPEVGTEPRKSLWRARVVVAVFFLGIALAALRERSSPLWPTGVCLIGAGVFALVWRVEFAEMNRRAREGSLYQVSEDGHRFIAVVWGLVVLGMGCLLFVFGIGSCG